jgi:hypothetical protein
MEFQEANCVSNISVADELHLDKNVVHLRREQDIWDLDLWQALLQSSCEYTIVLWALTACIRRSLIWNTRAEEVDAAREEERAEGTTYSLGLVTGVVNPTPSTPTVHVQQCGATMNSLHFWRKWRPRISNWYENLLHAASLACATAMELHLNLP